MKKRKNNEIKTNSLNNLGLENILNSMSGIIFWQDLDHVIHGANNTAVKHLGYKSTQSIIGTTPYEFRCKAVENSPKFVHLDDKSVQTNQTITSIIVDTLAGGVDMALLTNKSPIIKNNQVVGVLTHATPINQTGYLTDVGVNLYRQDVKKSNHSGIYIIEDHANNVKLSTKEMECLFYFIRGKTMREISDLLFLSPRTIEFHIEKIKEKFDCQSKSDLIEKAISDGYMANIPKRLLTKRLVLVL